MAQQLPRQDKQPTAPVIAVVGPCSAGKSTLLPALRAAGYDVRSPAQEHTIVANLWQRKYQPDVLIYLDVSYDAARARRPHIDGGPQRLAAQHKKLSHALKHCDYYLDTSDMSPLEVQEAVLDFLER